MTPTACTGRRFSRRRLGPLDYRTLGNLGNTDDIEVALAWKPDRGLLASFRNLKLIVSLGMGVDHLLADDKLPAGVPIVRIMDDGLIGQMSEYAIYWALRHHRDIDKYAASQRARQWKAAGFRRHHSSPRRRPGPGHDRPGHGEEVRGARLPHGGLEPHGQERCRASRRFTARTASAASWRAATSWSNVLPLTRDTRGLLDAKAFAALPKGAYFINMARGGHVVDEALLAALDSVTCQRRRARRLQPGTVAGGPSLLDASQGARDAAHRRRHQPAHRLARRDREHQAPAQRPRAAASRRSEDGVLDTTHRHPERSRGAR